MAFRPHRPLYPICLFSQTLPLITSVKGNERIASSLSLIKALHKGIYSTKMLSAVIPKIATFDKMLQLCSYFGDSYSSMGLPRYYCFGCLFPGSLSCRKLDGGSNEMRYRSFLVKFSSPSHQSNSDQSKHGENYVNSCHKTSFIWHREHSYEYRAAQGCRAVWSIPEEFFWQTSLPGDALLRWRPTSPSFKWLSAWKSESEIVSALKSKSKNISSQDAIILAFKNESDMLM